MTVCVLRPLSPPKKENETALQKQAVRGLARQDRFSRCRRSMVVAVGVLTCRLCNKMEIVGGCRRSDNDAEPGSHHPVESENF